jgi:DNA-binding HxlR family transcriptional regulator
VAHPVIGLNDVVHQRVRLGILAVLAEARRVDFNYLKRTLELTDGNLARHLNTLVQSGYLAIEKVFEGRKPRTWVSMTDPGQAALRAEIRLLRAIVDGQRS